MGCSDTEEFIPGQIRSNQFQVSMCVMGLQIVLISVTNACQQDSQEVSVSYNKHLEISNKLSITFFFNNFSFLNFEFYKLDTVDIILKEIKICQNQLYWDTLLHCSCSNFQFYCLTYECLFDELIKL